MRNLFVPVFGTSASNHRANPENRNILPENRKTDVQKKRKAPVSTGALRFF